MSAAWPPPAAPGILIKGSVYLEEGRKLAWLAFDKTGTICLQTGQTRFPHACREWILSAAVNWRLPAVSRCCVHSHPVSQAIANAADQHGIKRKSVDAFEALPGRGVRGVIEGKAYSLGNRLMHELDRCSSELEARLDELGAKVKRL